MSTLDELYDELAQAAKSASAAQEQANEVETELYFAEEAHQLSQQIFERYITRSPPEYGLRAIPMPSNVREDLYRSSLKVKSLETRLRVEGERNLQAARRVEELEKEIQKRLRPRTPSPPPPPPPPPTPTALIHAWINSFIDTDYSQMTLFPAPPALCPCASQLVCASQERALQVCACQLRQIFQVATLEELKRARNMFHPDRFSTCPVEEREVIQGCAKEVFVVVDEMYQVARG